MPHDAPQQAPEHVATPLIRRHDLVPDQECDGPAVVGHDPQAHVRALRGTEGRPGGSLRVGDDRANGVDLE